jgi:hypothetical protein
MKISNIAVARQQSVLIGFWLENPRNKYPHGRIRTGECFFRLFRALPTGMALPLLAGYGDQLTGWVPILRSDLKNGDQVQGRWCRRRRRPCANKRKNGVRQSSMADEYFESADDPPKSKLDRWGILPCRATHLYLLKSMGNQASRGNKALVP